MKDFMDELDMELDSLSGPSHEVAAKKTIHTDHQNTTHEKDVSQSQEKKSPKADNNNQSNNTQQKNQSSRSREKKSLSDTYKKRILEFPETKFFLPTLRKGYTRFIPI